MKRVTGIGGIFFKATDPNKLIGWYHDHLGLQPEEYGPSVNFKWRDQEDPSKSGMTVLSIFEKDTKYFGPKNSGFMMNFRVDDLDSVLEALASEGVEIDPRREDYDYGRFAWIVDPEGNRIELWQPLGE
jgi:predicted enzyme related to lactoylglutathione lyase